MLSLRGLLQLKSHQRISLATLVVLLSIYHDSSAQRTDVTGDNQPEATTNAPVIEALQAPDAEELASAEVDGLEAQEDLILTEAFAQKITADGRLLDQSALASGDLVQIGVRVRNEGKHTLKHAIVTQPLPESLVYVDSRPTGNRNASQLTAFYSVDQGRFFSTLDLLKIKREDGVEYPASPADVSHIRWILDYPLRPRQSTLLSFQAIVR